jgi:surfactin synthase thioesterase subunit
MGIGASLFTRFLLDPPAGCDLVAVQTPGRENRSAEPVVQSIDELADQIVPNLLPLLDRPAIVWGHSLGGIVAWEVVRRLRERRGVELAHFVVTGTAPPHLIVKWQKREVMLKAMVADNSPEYLVSLSRYVDNPELLAAIIPRMRRDFPLLQSYRPQAGPPLDCPITAFSARQDDMVYADEIGEWSGHTRERFELIEVDGDHWFLDRNRKLITTTLGELAAGIARASEGETDGQPRMLLAPDP